MTYFVIIVIYLLNNFHQTSKKKPPMSNPVNPRDNRTYTTEATSRRVLLMRRAAWGLVILALVHLFFMPEYKSILLDVGCFAVAVLLWLWAGKINRSRQERPAEHFDDNGNVKKKVL